jgi:hypothetical protein
MSGGTITIAGGPTLEFPEGAVTEEIEVEIEKISLPQTAPFEAISDVWQCEPDGVDFAVPVKVTLPYTSDGKPEALIFYWSFGGGDFMPVQDAQVADGIATGSIRHFSAGFVGRPKS